MNFVSSIRDMSIIADVTKKATKIRPIKKSRNPKAFRSSKIDDDIEAAGGQQHHHRGVSSSPRGGGGERFSDEHNEDDHADNGGPPKTPGDMVKYYRSIGFQAISVLNLIFNIVAMSINQGLSTLIAGIVACLVSPFVLVKEETMKEVGALREAQNEVRNDVNEIMQETKRLKLEIDALDGEINDLQDVNTKLDQIAESSGKDINTLIRLVKQNKEIQNQLQEITKAQVASQIIEIAMQSDMTGDKVLNGSEIDLLIIRLKNIPTITINEIQIRSQIESDPSVWCVLKMLKSLDDYHYGEEGQEQEEETKAKDEDKEEEINKTRSTITTQQAPATITTTEEVETEDAVAAVEDPLLEDDDPIDDLALVVEDEEPSIWNTVKDKKEEE